MANWIIPFASVSNRKYKIYIAGAQTDTELVGGTKPISIEEDNDTDFFVPVRTKTGFIHILDGIYGTSGSTSLWETILPLSTFSRRITLNEVLADSERTLFEGYLNPSTYSGEYLLPVQERSFDVIDPLLALQSVDVEPDVVDIANFAYILRYVLDPVIDIYRYAVFQGVDAISGWLRKKVLWDNFVDIDSDGVKTAKYNRFELLEEVCRFWGVTCRTVGDALYFVAPDDSIATKDFTSIYMQDLDEIAYGNDVQSSVVSWGEILLNDYTDEDGLFADRDNTEEARQGIRSVKVSADTNSQSYFLEINTDEVYELFKNETVIKSGNDRDGWKFYLTDRTGAATARYELSNMIVEFYGAQDYQYEGFFSIYMFYDGKIADLHNYSWTTALCSIGAANFEFRNYTFRITSKKTFMFSNPSMICLNADIDFDHTVNESKVAVTAKLNIGGYWWDGNDWQDTESTFTFYLGTGSGSSSWTSGKILDTRELDGIWDEYTGLGIPVDFSMVGNIFFSIVGMGTNFYDTCRFRNLRFSVARRKNDSHTKEGTNTYTKESGKAFEDTKDISTIFASDNNNTFGYGLIWNADNSYCSTIPYTSRYGVTNEHPEEHLAKRIARFGEVTRKRLELNLNYDTIGEVYPDTYVEDIYGVRYYPVAVSDDFVNDKKTLTLIEM